MSSRSWLLVFRFGFRLFRLMFCCSHARTSAHEGKCYCPDCGRGVIFRWVVLRCAECKARRSGHYLFNRLMPTDAYCAQCGEHRTFSETLESPKYFQLSQACLVMEEEAALRPSDSPGWHNTVYAWCQQNFWSQPDFATPKALLPAYATSIS